MDATGLVNTAAEDGADLLAIGGDGGIKQLAGVSCK